MLRPNLPQRREQQKIERLLIQLAKKKPASVKPAPIAQGQFLISTANSEFSFQPKLPTGSQPDTKQRQPIATTPVVFTESVCF